MKVFDVEKHGLPEDFVYFSAPCGVQLSPLVFAPNLRLRMVRSRVRHQERLCVSCPGSPELNSEGR